MLDVILKRFDSPDEVRHFENGRFELVSVGGLTIGRATYRARVEMVASTWAPPSARLAAASSTSGWCCRVMRRRRSMTAASTTSPRACSSTFPPSPMTTGSFRRALRLLALHGRRSLRPVARRASEQVRFRPVCAFEPGYDPVMELDRRACDRARLSRDPRFDGRFFIGVTSTGVYCRPICPARTPKDENVRYFPTAAAAEAAGFRPCLRCRPEASPGTRRGSVRRASFPGRFDSSARGLSTTGAQSNWRSVWVSRPGTSGACSYSTWAPRHRKWHSRAVCTSRRSLLTKRRSPSITWPPRPVSGVYAASTRRFATPFDGLRPSFDGSRSAANTSSPGVFGFCSPTARPTTGQVS